MQCKTKLRISPDGWGIWKGTLYLIQPLSTSRFYNPNSHNYFIYEPTEQLLCEKFWDKLSGGNTFLVLSTSIDH